MIKLISNRNINNINEPILIYYSSNKGHGFNGLILIIDINNNFYIYNTMDPYNHLYNVSAKEIKDKLSTFKHLIKKELLKDNYIFFNPNKANEFKSINSLPEFISVFKSTYKLDLLNDIYYESLIEGSNL